MKIKLYIPGPGMLVVEVNDERLALVSLQDLVSIPATIDWPEPTLSGVLDSLREPLTGLITIEVD